MCCNTNDANKDCYRDTLSTTILSVHARHHITDVVGVMLSEALSMRQYASLDNTYIHIHTYFITPQGSTYN